MLEDGLGALAKPFIVRVLAVLILVLLEDGLGVNTKVTIEAMAVAS